MTLAKVLIIIFIGLFLAGTLAMILLSDRYIGKDSKEKKNK